MHILNTRNFIYSLLSVRLMDHNEIVKQAKEIQNELRHEKEELIKAKKGPLKIIIGLLIMFIVVLMVLPYYSVRLDPEPKNIPSPSEVIPDDLVVPGASTDRSRTAFNIAKKSNPTIKQIADKVATISCEGNKICYAKALYYFVRDNLEYIGDPPDEYIKPPEETLITFSGDCDDASVLLAALLESIHIQTEYKFIPNHVYIEAYIPEIQRSYQKDGWVSLDPTCSNCDFGNLP